MQNVVAEMNHHNLTGLEIHPMAGKTLTSVQIDKTAPGYFVFWGATGIATGLVDDGGTDAPDATPGGDAAVDAGSDAVGNGGGGMGGGATTTGSGGVTGSGGGAGAGTGGAAVGAGGSVAGSGGAGQGGSPAKSAADSGCSCEIGSASDRRGSAWGIVFLFGALVRFLHRRR
jgi:MYXO-CTERM domain-containing protein